MPPRRGLLDANALLAEHTRAETIDDDLACELVSKVGIWISPRLFQRLPILLPHVVRDTSARSRSSAAGEQWASPNAYGYLRDDNSLIKEFVKSLRIESPAAAHDGMCIGRGWVAAHVWQFVTDGTRTTLDATTNSFVANMVWLPRALARRSDVQGSRFQMHLMAIARRLYGGTDFCPRLARIIESTWQRLSGANSAKIGSLGKVTFFGADDAWIDQRTQTITQVRDALRRVGHAADPSPRLRPTRYHAGLGGCDVALTAPTLHWLDAYLAALQEQRAYIDQ